MPPILTAVGIYFVLISLVSCAVTIADKRRARKRQWRVPEATLLLLAVLGGSAAMLLTMKIIRHKTQKAKFMVGIPAILALQAVAVIWLAGRAWGWF